MQRAALPRQPSINLSYVSLDPIIAEVALSPNLVVAEVNVRIAFYWLKDLRSYPEFHGLEEQLGDSVPASSLSTADPATLKGGAFVLYCRLCPLPLLSKRLQDDATELMLAHPDALSDVLNDEALRVAYEVIEDTLDCGPLSLAFLYDVLRFLRVSLWAARNSGERFDGQVAESLLILLPFSRSKSIGIRCLVVAALTSLASSDGPLDTQTGTCAFGSNDQPAESLATASWQGLKDSPFATFISAVPSGDRYHLVMSQFCTSPNVDWRSLGFALVEIIEEPNGPSTQRLEIDATDPGHDYSALEDISDALVAAMIDQAYDPEAAAILRLRAALAKGSYMDVLAQARKAVQDHPTFSFQITLKVSRKGLMCVSDDASPMLRRWLLWRAVVHGGLQGLSLAGRTIGGEGGDIRMSLALLKSAVKDTEALLRVKHDEHVIFPVQEHVLIWHILLSVALHGARLPDSITVCRGRSS
ncbi:hypothetical protein OH76DRAFT_1558032 [Lentinus brumalis]|uniref:Uncharacterized protein n=1 Tax=Lentinus brumalis TaxID=2498619 RepID=A0A371D329_9APHY|nr:hypothetical protein OH76DRAFT_1558032 [Polyporus brumalis]